MTRVEPTNGPGDVIVSFGRYKGKSIEAVFAEDAGYCGWLAARTDSVDSRTKRVAEYARAFLKAQGYMN